jgi:hypothetical protein
MEFVGAASPLKGDNKLRREKDIVGAASAATVPYTVCASDAEQHTAV